MAYTNIDDPSAYFQATTYTGTNSSGNAITNSGNSDLQPDMVWIKVRTYDNPHIIQDTSRGFAGNGEINLLQSASTSQELTNGGFESFDSNGFTVGGTNPTSRAYNGSTDNYIAWQWKANGGTTASNTDGGITTTVQANTDAGFSIVTWTGTGSATTLGHGLGVAPKMLIVKNRSRALDWAVYHTGLTDAGYVIALNSGDAQVDSGTNRWNHTDPTSSVFSVGAGQQTNQSGDSLIAYCFAEKQGYSKFGSYVGNGSTNGPFVYTGFKPAFLIVKKSSGTGNWLLYDNKRGAFNLNDEYFYINSNAGESTSATSGYDFLSNGFKTRNTYNDGNVSGQTYIYMAFAENPFVTSTGIPTTAR